MTALLIDDGGARHLTAGLAMPDVALTSTQGGTVSLASLTGTSVVYIYPWTGKPGFPNPPGWDDIPGAHGSTPQAEGFAARHPDFDAAGVAVFGISGQTSAGQAEFAARLNLPFALLSDHEFAFADALRLPRFTTGGTAYLTRLTFIIRNGTIAATIYPVPRPASHAAGVLDYVLRLS